MVAGYLAKYATKSTEATGHTSTRLTADTIDDYADPDGDHTARLIDACWRLGRPTGTPAPLPATAATPAGPARLRRAAGTARTAAPTPATRLPRPAPPTVKTALTPNRRTRRAANRYARLRRWAHMLGFGGHFLTKARRYSVTFQLLRDTRIAYRRARRPGRPSAPALVRAADHHDEETTLIVGTLTFAGVGWHTTGDALLANTAAALARVTTRNRPRRTRPRTRHRPSPPLRRLPHKPAKSALHSARIKETSELPLFTGTVVDQ